jgi:hypothetical protein
VLVTKYPSKEGEPAVETATDKPMPTRTAHAEIQLQRRGVRRHLMEFLIAHGDTDRDVGDGCISRSCSNFAIAEAGRQGILSGELEQLRKLVAILGRDGTIVTVINRPTWYARFQRGNARLSARERAQMAERRRRGGRCQ